MDTQDLFKPKKKNVIIPDKEKFIGLTDSLVYLPLIYGIHHNLIKHNFSLIFDSIIENANKLREGEIELGIISSLDYALKKETWLIVPDLCVSSTQKIKHVQLFFRRGLKNIRRIAMDKNAISEGILLRILMREKFQITPDYIEMEPDLEKMLFDTDAALIVGDQALNYAVTNQNRLDLNEEWIDLTGLPFVYAFWAGREFTINSEDIKILNTSFRLGLNNLEKISKNYAKTHKKNWTFYHDYLTQNVSYSFSDQEKDGLNEFYNYAFFYGFTEFIPELHFYKSSL
jgi:chorismate dehydratase